MNKRKKTRMKQKSEKREKKKKIRKNFVVTSLFYQNSKAQLRFSSLSSLKENKIKEKKPYI